MTETGSRNSFEISLADTIGGLRGLIDSGLSSTVFVAVYALAGRRLIPALVAALATTIALLVIRLVRHEPIRQAASGVFGVAVSAGIALLTGSAKNFFAIGIVIQPLYAVASIVLLAVGRPPIGLIMGQITGEGMAWRDDPPRRRAYALASWVWVFVFLFRTAVKLPFYLNDRVVALGVVNLLLGYPLFALAGLVSWMILRRVPPTLPAATANPAEPAEEPEIA